MKQGILKITALAAIILLIQPFGYGQPEKDKTKEKKEIMDEQDEIIITRKNTKDINSKITVEIKDGQAFINGKPIEEFNDDNIRIERRGRFDFDGDQVRTFNRSPFRTEDWGPSPEINILYDSKKALLGVSSDRAEGGGALVNEITKGSAAETSGLKKGDIITKIDEAKIDDPEDLVKVIRSHKPEDKVVVTYKRAGKEEKTTATLGKYNMEFHSYDGYQMPMDMDAQMTIPVPPVPRMRGMTAPRIYSYSYNIKGPRIGIKAQDTEDGKGAKVLDIDDDSPAAKAGIKEGDVITQLDGKNITSANELSDAAKAAKGKSAFKVKFIRAGKAQEVDVKIPKKLNTTEL